MAGGMTWTPRRVHLTAIIITITVAVTLLATLIPFAARKFFRPPLEGYSRLRGEVFYYLAIGLIPVGLWLVPSFTRRFAQTTIMLRRRIFAKSDFYVRFIQNDLRASGRRF